MKQFLEKICANPMAKAQHRQNLAFLQAIKGDLTSAEILMRRDLPEKMVEKNLEYYRKMGEPNQTLGR